MSIGIKKFFKPSWLKIIIFVIILGVMFYAVPFLQSSSGTSESLSRVVKNYSGTKQDFYFVLFGSILYLLTAYFISCAAFQIWDDLRKKQKQVSAEGGKQ